MLAVPGRVLVGLFDGDAHAPPAHLLVRLRVRLLLVIKPSNMKVFIGTLAGATCETVKGLAAQRFVKVNIWSLKHLSLEIRYTYNSDLKLRKQARETRIKQKKVFFVLHGYSS